jgi:hypothetical protein
MSTQDESYEFCFTLAEMAVVVEALKGLARQHSSMATTWLMLQQDRNYEEQKLRRRSDEEAKAAATAYEVARIIEQRMKRIRANLAEPPEVE